MQIVHLRTKRHFAEAAPTAAVSYSEFLRSVCGLYKNLSGQYTGNRQRSTYALNAAISIEVKK